MLAAARFVTIMLTALSMGAAFAHLLELPAKIGFDGALWLTLLQRLYPAGFGTVGAFCEVAAVVMSVVVTVLLRRHTRAFRWMLAGALGMVATHAIFWIWVAPVNAALLPLTAERLPADWTRLRDQWEWAHASRAILQILALAAMVTSVLVEVDGSRRRRDPASL